MNKWITHNEYEIHQLLKGRSNCFLVIKNKKALLVDTGRNTKRQLLTKRIEEYRGISLSAIILTHSHFDHAENAAYLKKKYSIPVFIQQEEVEFLLKGENPPVKGSYKLTRFFTNLWEDRIKSHLRYEGVTNDFVVQKKMDLDFLGFHAYLLHTPGHSPGSMSLIVDDEIAIVGDAMFGVVRLFYPPFANDPDQMVRSWGKLLDTGCRIFLPAHGTLNKRERVEKQYRRIITNYKLRINEKQISSRPHNS
jgi:glyoxylase-like metal-dependent hydrolase (beta-lactamase superfamily II)